MSFHRQKSRNAKINDRRLKQKVVYTRTTELQQVEDDFARHVLSWLKQAEFLMSAPKLSLCIEDQGFEIAFAGRSNAGKSTAINTITNQKQLARASKRPGRTQMINFFTLTGGERRLVDLPGYGYAAVPEEMKKVWQKEMQSYLTHRQSLQGLILLMDSRHPLQDFDQMMLEWAYHHGLFVHVVLTKADKFNRSRAQEVLLQVKNKLQKQKINVSVQLFSSLNGIGLSELATVIAGRLQWTLETHQAEQLLAAEQIQLASTDDSDSSEFEDEIETEQVEVDYDENAIDDQFER